MIGWRETISLPEIGMNQFAAKIDTGALTTALHATNIMKIRVEGRSWVQFVPDHGVLQSAERCMLPILHTRAITNTSGVPEDRFIVATTLKIGSNTARVEVSLTDRSDMKYPIIIGRSALRLLRLTVDPSRSWLVSKSTRRKKNK